MGRDTALARVFNVTVEQMHFFGYVEIEKNTLDLEDSAVQKQLLRGKSAFRCRQCNDVTWVKLGYKQTVYVGDNIHWHLGDTKTLST